MDETCCISDYNNCIPIPIAKICYLCITQLSAIMQDNIDKLRGRDLFWKKEIPISFELFRKIDSHKVRKIIIDPQKYQFKRTIKNIDSYFLHAVKIRIDQVCYFKEKNIVYATVIDIGCF